MKSENEQYQRLFDQLKQSPTELSLEEVASIIERLPGLPPPKPNGGWSDFLNLNNLIMISIPVVIVTVFFVLVGNNEPVEKISSTETINQEIIIPEVNAPEIPAVVNTPSIQEESALPQAKKEVQETQKVESKASQIVESQQQISQASSPKLAEPVELDVKDLKPKRLETKTKREGPGRSIAQVVEKPDPVPLPGLSTWKIKKLKRMLYKNLKADGLISSKSVFVEIALPGDKIVVNEKELRGNLYDKYLELTRSVGSGVDRKIKMDQEYIKVGDFTDKGFDGYGVGTFREDFVETDNSFFKPQKSEQDLWEEFVEEEQKELSLFAKKILEKAPAKKGKGALFGVNLNFEKCVSLHQELYEQLIKDQIVISKADFVIIELPKEKIIINGTELSGQQFLSYEKIIAKYKIKHAGKREIRLSENTLSVGDYSPGNFTGTSAVFDEE